MAVTSGLDRRCHRERWARIPGCRRSTLSRVQFDREASCGGSSICWISLERAAYHGLNVVWNPAVELAGSLPDYADVWHDAPSQQFGQTQSQTSCRLSYRDNRLEHETARRH